MLRSPQFDELARHQREEFARSVARDVEMLWPDRYHELGADVVTALARDGALRAAVYGIVSRANVARYVHTMVALGRDFDSDPRYPWARILLSARTMPEVIRMRKIGERTVRELQRKRGDGE